MSGKTSFSLARWYDQRPLRERIILLSAAVILLLVLVNLSVVQPCKKRLETARRQQLELETSLAYLIAREAEVNARKNVDPNLANRLRVEALEEKSAELQQQLEANIVNLVSPREMPELLKTLLTRQKKLHLLNLENLPPETVEIGPAADGQQGPSPVLFRHRLKMTFSGDYLTMLAYLRQLEQLPRSMVWEDVAIETVRYPETIVRLQVHTLSLTEGWIGG